MQSIIETTEELIETFRDTENTIANFSSPKQEQLYQSLNQIISGFQKLENLPEESFDNIELPRSAIKYVSENKNPDVYMKKVLFNSLLENQRIVGKKKALETFRNNIVKEMKLKYPDFEDMKLL